MAFNTRASIRCAFRSEPARTIQPMYAHVNCLLWGDRHLLDLKTHEGVQIVTPARFVAILATTSP